MSTVVRSMYCYPREWTFGGVPIRTDERHEECSGGHAVPGVMGGWVCPCPCHRSDRIDGTGGADG